MLANYRLKAETYGKIRQPAFAGVTGYQLEKRHSGRCEIKAATHALVPAFGYLAALPNTPQIVETGEPKLSGKNIASPIGQLDPQFQVVPKQVIPCETILTKTLQVFVTTQELRLVEGGMTDGKTCSRSVGQHNSPPRVQRPVESNRNIRLGKGSGKLADGMICPKSNVKV